MLGPKIEPAGPRHVIWEGAEYLFFGGNDYHRFAFNEEVIEASIKASRRWGLNLSGSRTTSANHPIYEELETALAAFLGSEAAAICSAGYMSNGILMQAIADRFTHVLLDSGAHSSLVEAAQTSQLPMIRYEHCSSNSLSSVLASLRSGARPIVLTDGVFASTGAIAPLDEIPKMGLPMAVDDAHGMGTLGSRGQGTWNERGIHAGGAYQTGTLSKGLGGFGGVIAADRATIETVKSRSSALTGSTPMPIPMAAAALKSIDILRREPNLVQDLQKRSLEAKSCLKALGFRVSDGPSPICSVTFHDAKKNGILYQALTKAGIYPNFIDYPGSPPGGHFRFTLSTGHTDEDIERLLATIETTVQLIC